MHWRYRRIECGRRNGRRGDLRLLAHERQRQGIVVLAPGTCEANSVSGELAGEVPLHNRHVEGEVIAAEGHGGTIETHRMLVKAVERTVFLSADVALYMHLNAKRRTAGLQGAQPDAIDTRGLFSGHKRIAREDQRHGIALIPRPCQSLGIAGDGSFPCAMHDRHRKAESFTLKLEVRAGKPVRALIRTVHRSTDRPRCVKFQMEPEVQGTERSHVVAGEVWRGLRSCSKWHCRDHANAKECTQGDQSSAVREKAMPGCEHMCLPLP